jgi:hypothetical protein
MQVVLTIQVHEYMDTNRLNKGQRDEMINVFLLKINMYTESNKTKDQVTRSPLKTVDELRCSGRSKYLQ